MTPEEQLKEAQSDVVFMRRLVDYQDQKIEALLNQVQTLNEQAAAMKALLAQSAQKMQELEDAANKDDRPVNPILQASRLQRR